MIEHELEQQEAPLLRSVGARRFDASFVTGALVAGILLLVAMFSSGHFLRFLSPTSLLIVLGGTFAALVINFSLSDLHNAWRACREVLFERGEEPLDRILYLVDLAPRVKREGVLMLEQEADRVKDPLLAKAFELLADGQTPAEIKRILENDALTSNEYRRRAIQIFQSGASFAPAMGLIGTLIGLIELLDGLSNPATIGPAMAVALLTTFYGAVLANLIFLPISGKLRLLAEEQALLATISIEGILSLARQENSIVLEQRLHSFLPVAVGA